MCSVRIGGCLSDGKSIEIALEDLTVESIGISKVRTLLADVWMRSLHGGQLADLMNPRPWPIIYNLESILEHGGTRNSLGYKAKGRVIDNVGIAATPYLGCAKLIRLGIRHCARLTLGTRLISVLSYLTRLINDTCGIDKF